MLVKEEKQMVCPNNTKKLFEWHLIHAEYGEKMIARVSKNGDSDCGNVGTTNSAKFCIQAVFARHTL